MAGSTTFLFDLGGVLLDWNPRYLYRTVIPDTRAMEYFLTDVCDSEWNRSMDAGKPIAQAIHERQLERPEFAELIGFWQSRWQTMLGDPIQGSVRLLQELKELGYPLLSLTNWSAETFPIARKRFPFLSWFERIVVSGEVGLAKPDPAIFHLTIAQCGLDPHQTVFIDDQLANIATARNLGFDAIPFQDPGQLRRELQDRKLLPA